MPPLITLAVLCKRISQDDDGLFTLHGLADSIILLDETGPLYLFGVVWLLPQESGDALIRAVVLSPSGEKASNEYRPALRLEAGIPKKLNFEFAVEPYEEGLYWFVVEVGQETVARFPLGVRWAPDSAQARRQKPPGQR